MIGAGITAAASHGIKNDSAAVGGDEWLTFDPTTATKSDPGSIETATPTDRGNGWYRYSFDCSGVNNLISETLFYYVPISPSPYGDGVHRRIEMLIEVDNITDEDVVGGACSTAVPVGRAHTDGFAFFFGGNGMTATRRRQFIAGNGGFGTHSVASDGIGVNAVIDSLPNSTGAYSRQDPIRAFFINPGVDPPEREAVVNISGRNSSGFLDDLYFGAAVGNRIARSNAETLDMRIRYKTSVIPDVEMA